MTARVTISLPDSLVERLDEEARELGVPRSQLVQESLAAYLGATREQREAQARRRRVLGALERMKSMTQVYPLLDRRSGQEILQEIRRLDDATDPGDAGARSHENG